MLLGRGELGASALRIDVVAAIVAAVLVWLAVRFATDLLRQHGRLLLRIDHLETALEAAGIVVPEPHVGIPLGEPAPDFTAIALDGTPRTLAELVQAARPVLLVFTDPACAMCVALAPKLGEWGRELSIVTTHDTTGRLARAYGSKGTPSAVVISTTGTIASSHAQGANAIEMLARRAIAGDFDPAPGLRIGAALPEVVLADLDGASVPLAAKLDPAADTIVVFWNPSCGFCAAMRDELRELTGTRAMIIVSAGESARVRAEGFRAPTLLDPDLLGAAKLEVNGTPIAVLVGPDATIRSDLVVGAKQIFELARR